MNPSTDQPQQDPDYRALAEKAEADETPHIHDDFADAENIPTDILAGVTLPAFVSAVKIGNVTRFMFTPPAHLRPHAWPASIPMGGTLTAAGIPSVSGNLYKSLISRLKLGVRAYGADENPLIPR